MINLKPFSQEVSQANSFNCCGRVVGIKGKTILASMPNIGLGNLCKIERFNLPPLKAQVTSFNSELAYLSPLDELIGVRSGAVVETYGKQLQVKFQTNPLGKVLDALGKKLSVASICAEQGKPIVRNIFAPPPPALQRARISTQLYTGVKSIDSLCPIAYGQRMALLAPAGLGKSTLMGMIANNAKVDLNVVALVGERGREVKEFIEDCLGEEGLKKTVVIVSTSDEPALRRVLATYTATAIAEYFREQGKDVLLLVDSITRMASAQREIGLAAGELPLRQGYTAGVFSILPQLFERAGMGKSGSITAIYSLLCDEFSELDPLSSEVKSILDGHIVLSRYWAEQGVRPAIDHSVSLSRLETKILKSSKLKRRQVLRKFLTKLSRDKEIVLLGGKPDAELSVALELEAKLKDFLTQTPDQSFTINQIESEVESLLNHAGAC